MQVSSEIPFITKKVGLIAGATVIIVFTLVLGWWLMKPSWVPLLSENVTPESRTETVQYLMEWGLPFKEDDATGHILVKQSQVITIRNQLSETGVLANVSPGMEIFNKSEYGMSDFTQRINYQRAIEGEIAQTIRSFADVKSARVHLTLPKQSIFRDKQSEPKASVVIQTRQGQILSEDQVFGITKLVAASIDDLPPNNVTVLDHNGLILSADGENPSARRLHSSRSMEILYANKAKELVKGIIQTGEVKVAVSTEISLDRVKSIKDQVIPGDGTTAGFLQKTKRQITNAISLNKNEKTSPAEKSSVIEEEFLFSRERSEIEYATGQLKSVSVGIVVVKDIPPNLISNIETVVASGLGLDKERGDKITVVSVPLQTTHNDTSNNKKMVPKDNLLTNTNILSNYLVNLSKIHLIILFTGMIALIILIAYLFRKRTRKPLEIHLSEKEQERLLRDIRTWITQEHQESV